MRTEIEITSVLFVLLVSGAVHAQDTILVPAEVGTIQGAIDSAAEGDTVLVAPGCYDECIDFSGKAITVASEAGPGVTEIRGDASQPVVKFHDAEGPDSCLIGFRITGGRVPFITDPFGGGVSCETYDGGPTSPYIADCVIEENLSSGAQEWGLGVAGNPIMERCVIRSHVGTTLGTDGLSYGGGVYGSPTLIDCVIEDNVAGRGGGLLLEDGAYLEGCTIRGNTAGPLVTQYGPFPANGGGIHVPSSNATIELVRCVITGNNVWNYDDNPYFPSTLAWGAALSVRGEAKIVSCTLTGNTLGANGAIGGIDGPDCTVVNSIVRSNEDELDQYSNATGFSYSNIEGGAPGLGNIDADPLFVDETAGDYNLSTSSPCIDAGSPKDSDPDWTRADMGALHYAQANHVVLNGSGVNPRCLSERAAAVLGGSWTVELDTDVQPGAFMSYLAAWDAPLQEPLPIDAGEVLVDILAAHLVFQTSTSVNGGVSYFSLPVPADTTYLGFEFYAQGFALSSTGATLCNALGVVVGHPGP